MVAEPGQAAAAVANQSVAVVPNGTVACPVPNVSDWPPAVLLPRQVTRTRPVIRSPEPLDTLVVHFPAALPRLLLVTTTSVDSPTESASTWKPPSTAV
jgi:hypothetical protein